MTNRADVKDAIETIDAAMFVGHSMYSWEAIAELELYMASWQRELNLNKELMLTEPETYGEEPK